MGGGAKAAGVAVAVAAVALAGYGLWPRATPEGVPAAVMVPTVRAPAQDTAAVPEPVSTPEVPPQSEVPAPQVALAFDNWRVDADGTAVVAGRAAPGAVVTVLVDGLAVAEAPSTTRGEFVALFTLPPNPNPSLMRLTAILPDGSTVQSSQSVALAAIAGPMVVAEAEAEPVPAPAPNALAAEETSLAPDVPVDPAVAAEAAAPPKPDAAATPPESAPAALMVTDEGVRVLQGPEADAQMDVSLDAIAYTAAGDVQLSGTGQTGQFIRIYLDDAPVATVPVGAAGQWSLTLADTPAGIYTLRVDQVDATGAVTARVETPFKRETREALAALIPGPAAIPAPIMPAASAEGAPTVPEILVAPAEIIAPAEVAPAETVVAPPEPVAVAQANPPQATQTAVAPVAATDPPPDQGAAPVMTSIQAPNPPETPVPAARTPALAEPVGEASAPAALPSVSITVQPGYTLWGIARQQLGEGVLYVQVFEANKDRIRNPDLIYPGQVFVLPTR